MNKHSVILTAALAFGAMTTTVFAQGYGSSGGAAAVLGFTTSPPTARNGHAPAVAAPVEAPVATGTVFRRDRTWTRLQHR